MHHFELLHRLTRNYQLEKIHVIDGVFKIADEVCEEKKKLWMISDEKKHTLENDGYSRKPKTFIRLLLNPKNGLDDKEIKDEINTLIGAVCC